MSNRVAWVLGVAGLLLVSWTVVGQDANRTGRTAGDGGRFMVTNVGGTGVLCDSLNGQTWMLIPPNEVTPNPVWMPVKRLDSEEAVQRWRQELDAVVKKRIESQKKNYNAP